MTIYVHSRGKSQEHDYNWLEEASQISVIPEVLKSIKPEELINSQKPSMILARSGGQLILLVTALTTRDGRTDFMRRQIRNVIAWVETDTSASERVLCKIAAQALNGELDRLVDSAVTNNAESQYGFTADFTQLKAIENTLNNQGDDQDTDRQKYNPDTDLKVGKNSEPLRSDLAEQLAEYGLPKPTDGTQLLVVATTLKSFDGLTSKNVWRGLSSRIENEEWEVYKKKGAATEQTSEREQSAATTKKSPIITILILLIVVIVIAVLISTLVPQNPQPKDQPPLQSSSVTPLNRVKIVP